MDCAKGADVTASEGSGVVGKVVVNSIGSSGLFVVGRAVGATGSVLNILIGSSGLDTSETSGPMSDKTMKLGSLAGTSGSETEGMSGSGFTLGKLKDIRRSREFP